MGIPPIILNEFDIPVAITYGNHDTEGQYNRQYLRDAEAKLNNLANKHHSYLVDDRENYTLEIFDSETDRLVNVIYVWNSGDYSNWSKISKYAAIGRHQINWYAKTSNQPFNKTFDIGFLHIPLAEYLAVNKEQVVGSYNEKPCPATINSGLFHELLVKDKVKAIFAGHDHDNNFASEYFGIQLNYGNVTGYNAYGRLARGVLAIDLYNDKVERRIIKF